MLTRTLPLGTLPAGARFRFPEEPRTEGYPYVVLPTPATYRGDRHFPPEATPVVIHRKDGRYPRYGQVAGYYPVQNDQGQVVAWVASSKTLVRVPVPWARSLGPAALALLVMAIALATTYGLLTRLGES